MERKMEVNYITMKMDILKKQNNIKKENKLDDAENELFKIYKLKYNI